MLIDTHAHLNFGAYKDDYDEVIKRTLAAGTRVINVGSQSTTSERAVELAKKYDGLYAAVGLHPTHLFEMEVDESEIDVHPVKSPQAGSQSEFNRVKFKSRKEEWNADFYEKLAKNKKVVAIGEIGLDYNFIPKNVYPVKSPQTGSQSEFNRVNFEVAKKKQQKVFRQALNSADKLNLPVIIHSRDTHDDIIPILKKFLDAGKLQRRGVLHCFTGNWTDAKKYLDLGFLISFTGIITFKSRPNQTTAQKQILEVVKNIPLEKIMIETDSPYLTPDPHRGKRNEPLYVKFVAQKIAEIKNISFEEVAKQTTENAEKIFKI